MGERLAEALELIEVLRAENESLRNEVAVLKALLSADSSTTPPPSTNPVGTRKKRAQRRADARAGAKRAQGKQPGTPGSNLARRRADRLVDHEPPACGCCGADLTGAEVVGSETRQVIDLLRVTPTVTDHLVVKRRCDCGAVTAGTMLPPEARAPVCWGPGVRAFALYMLNRQHLPVERTAELLAEVLGAPVSTGWLCNLQTEAAGKLAPFLAEGTTRLPQNRRLRGRDRHPGRHRQAVGAHRDHHSNR